MRYITIMFKYIINFRLEADPNNPSYNIRRNALIECLGENIFPTDDEIIEETASEVETAIEGLKEMNPKEYSNEGDFSQRNTTSTYFIEKEQDIFTLSESILKCAQLVPNDLVRIIKIENGEISEICKIYNQKMSDEKELVKFLNPNK